MPPACSPRHRSIRPGSSPGWRNRPPKKGRRRKSSPGRPRDTLHRARSRPCRRSRCRDSRRAGTRRTTSPPGCSPARREASRHSWRDRENRIVHTHRRPKRLRQLPCCREYIPASRVSPNNCFRLDSRCPSCTVPSTCSAPTPRHTAAPLRSCSAPRWDRRTEPRAPRRHSRHCMRSGARQPRA
jgi:hypothetical protein